MMQINYTAAPRLCAALLLAGVIGGGGAGDQDAPALAGPSEFATVITLTATPDTLVQDGSSQATIQVTAVDVNGRPVSGLQLLFSASSSSPTVQAPAFTADSVATD